MTTEYAAAAAPMSTVNDLDNNEAEVDSSDGDDSVVVVSKKLAMRPAEGKTPFFCIPGDILRVMQDRLSVNIQGQH